jgi:NAD(P)-dependent dehydrogenase (short-subunit alcohol dehydrogenase family)
MLLDGRVAIVTGAGRGIGRAFARCLAEEGAAVVVNDVGAALDGADEGDDPATLVCKEIADRGGRAVPAHWSVSDFDGAARTVHTAIDAFGRVDILVNNAGILRDKVLWKMDEADFDAVIAVHLKGSFNMARHAVPHMKAQAYGRIVNVTSSAGLRGNFGQTNYGAAKAGLMGMTFVWALELARFGITVNAMAPAGATRMTMPLYERSGGTPPSEADAALNAPLVAYLASERAAHVSGQVFGRTGFSYTLFQTPRQIAHMHQPGGWSAAEVADHFDEVLGQHLQPVGMAATMGLDLGART